MPDARKQPPPPSRRKGWRAARWRTPTGLHFSPYALLTEVVEREFADEVAEQEREPFCRRLYPHLNNLFAGYDTSDDTFALSPAHDLLYTELVGTVMLYLESYGVQ